MIRVKMFMKSGNIVEFWTKKIERKNDKFGNLIGLTWENISGKERLFEIDLGSVEAITALEVDEAEESVDD